MLIPVNELAALDVPLDGIVHVGAHWAEEARDYESAGCSRVLWIEGDDAHRRELLARLAPFDHRVAFGIVADKPGETVTFNRTDDHLGNNAGQSSSILPFGTHAVVHDYVKVVGQFQAVTTTIDELYGRHWYPDGPAASLVNIDIQGAELLALQGAHRLLSDVAAVYTEVNVDELYLGGALLPELDAFLVSYGFECRRCVLAGDQRRGGPGWLGWGDGLWIRTDGYGGSFTTDPGPRSSATPRRFADRFPAEVADWYPDGLPERAAS